MESIGIDASPNQLRKLRKGMKVRIKSGTGFNLIVHPDTYRIMSHTFGKNKGIDIALSPDELHANQNAAMAGMEGGSIFGKKFDRKHKGLMKVLHPIGAVIKPAAKELTKYGIDMGSAALKAYAPELSPYIDVGARKLNNTAQSYIENPDATYRKARNTVKTIKGHRDSSGSHSAPDMSMVKKMAKAEANKYLNSQLGTNFDYMNRAGLEQAGSNALTGYLDQQMMALRHNAAPMGEEVGYGLGGRLLRGYGLGGRLHMREISSIGRGAGMVGAGAYIPPALRSQPAGANFQMQHFLPPQYQQYWNPELDYMGGSGLYT